MDEVETKKDFTDVSTNNVKYIYMSRFAFLNKCPKLQAKKLVRRNNSENVASEIDYNLTFREQNLMNLEHDNSSGSEIAIKNQFQTLKNEFHDKETFTPSLGLVVKEESPIDVEYDNLQCEVTTENQYQYPKSEFLDDKKELQLSLDLEIKEENQIDVECDDCTNYEITTENQYQDLKSEFFYGEKELHLSLDLGIKKENQIDVECDDCNNYEITTENQFRDLKNDFLAEKELQASRDLLRMETDKYESFNQSIKQGNKSPNIYNSTNSVTDWNEAESKDITDSFSNVNSLDLDNVNMNCFVVLNKCTNRNIKSVKCADGNVGYYEVFERRNCGSKTTIFKSIVCPYTTIFVDKIIQHCVIHNKNKNYNCLYCNFTAKCLFLWKRHIFTHVDNHFECKICPFTNTSASTLKSHILLKHTTQVRPIPYSVSKLHKRSSVCGSTNICNICNFKTRDVDSYQKHVKIHLKRISKDERELKKSKQKKQICKTKTIKSRKIAKKKYRCKKCSFVTDILENMSNHIQTHNKSSETDEGSAIDSSEGKLEPESLLSRTILSCNSCSFKTTLKIVFLKHKQSHTTSPPGIFQCSECHFSTTKKKLLLSHLINHAYKYLYRCTYCNFSSNNKATLRSHKNSHKKPREKTNVRFFRKNKMTVSLHAKNKQTFKCLSCDYYCSSEFLLNQHSVNHLEFKLYKCTYCNYDTNFKGNLVKHILIHVSEYRICGS
ncbi:UNVERIFIED_CONTAM: hypothetical protein RMT77_019961 [Armadillidium vulgare]